MKCKCEKNCIKSSKDILNSIDDYEPCDECTKRTLKKAIPLKNQVKLDQINENYKRCSNCQKRHIDFVMAHILKIMIDNNQISDSSSIRKVGTPLVTPAFYLEYLPYLNENSLVIITKTVDKETADKIFFEVPEVKAVIYGDTSKTVGQLSENDEINQYELLSGCDIRCDVQNTPTQTLLIYKEQSKIHIEYPKKQSPKIQDVDEILSKYENPTVIDAMAGPGTLGMYALTKNAKKVLFNDIYDTAIENLKLNLKVNGFDSNYEILNEDINNLSNIITEKYDVGLIDAFPGIDIEKYKKELEKVCKNVFII